MTYPRLLGLISLLVHFACSPDPGLESSETQSDTASASTGSGGDEGDLLEWAITLDGCGHAYGVAPRGDDSVIIGEVDGVPTAIRVDKAGAVIWTRAYAPDVSLYAIHEQTEGFLLAGDAADDTGAVIAIDDDGEVLTQINGIGVAPAGLFGVAGISGTGDFAVTGYTDNSDLLVQRFSVDGVGAPAWDAPSGGYAPAIGFAARAHPSGVAVCGRSPALEGGRSWTAVYDPSGQQLWEAEGPQAGDGAFSDCWDMSVAPSGAVAVVDSGYTGARIVLYDAGGGITWELAEGNTGAQAVDVAADGRVFVGGWSAEADATPFRSHSVGEKAGWVVEIVDGQVLRQAPAAAPLSLRDLRVHASGAVTAVGDLESDSSCPQIWIGRYDFG